MEASGAGVFHAFTRDLWLEFKIAADYATGMSEPTRGTVVAPPGFVRDELGFGLDSPDQCGPGCRCNALRSARPRRGPTNRPRTGRQWQKLISSAMAVAKVA